VTKVVITGYASLDHVAMLDGVPQPGQTTTILQRPVDAWPRLGGSPAYVAAALVDNGVVSAFPVSWVGNDEDGTAYREQLSKRRIAHLGVEAVAGALTPIAILAYEPTGGCICLYHPGMPKDLTLSVSQRKLVAEADWLCVTIGPPKATEAALDALAPTAGLAWVVKHDPRSQPPQLAARLAANANLICFSQAERGFVDEALAASGGPAQKQLLIETRGRSGALVKGGGSEHFVAAAPVATDDPTGAGDSFAGGVLAALVNDEANLIAIVEAGHRAARRLLEARGSNRPESA
jgi:ribokinase